MQNAKCKVQNAKVQLLFTFLLSYSPTFILLDEVRMK